ncbi:hypothetical protein ACJMK2_038745 [Sinanodonta woodiana]|uniref:Nose resistant-to-fluoxetine protein N-terminal domain-containing protein n=1 Tax=Sinanodonta woodiana TaxID=1069815 RepID=A0ABD3WBC3_SINWO
MSGSTSVLRCMMCIMLLYGPVISLDSSSINQSSNGNFSIPDFRQLLSSLGNVSLPLDVMSTMFQQLIGSMGNRTSFSSPVATPVLEQVLKSPQMNMLISSPVGQQLQGILADGGIGKYLTSVMSKLSTECQNDVQLLLGAISKGEGWALKFLDAIGKPPSGILDGHTLWLGSYDECVDANVLNNATQFRGQYCLADISMTGILPSMPGSPAKITVAICVPDTCQLNSLGLPITCDKNKSFVEDQSAVAITAVVSVLGAIILLATMYDVIRQHVTKNSKLSQVTEMDVVAAPHEHINGFTNPSSNSDTLDKTSSNKYNMKPEQCEKREPGFGLLVAYLSLRDMQKVGGIKKFNWIMYYFHRFWRLTPPYMLFLFFYSILFPYLDNGPFWFYSSFKDWDMCKESWWTNLLYVNNLVKTDKMCMAWSWYLANDMQFYILSPLILIPFFISPVGGMIMSLVFLIITTVVPGVIAAQKHYSALFPDITGNPAMVDYFDKVYIKPYCRMGPYVVGLITGYVLYRTKRQVNMHKVLNLLGWAVAASINIAVLYGLYNPDNKHVLNEPESAAYIALYRTGWAIGVCWVVFACATGNGGPVNTLLSWSPFVPLSRLTYCAYLVHPMIMFYIFGMRRTTVYFAYPEMVCSFLGFLVIAYLVAFVLSLAFESPMMGLEKVFFKPGRK